MSLTTTAPLSLPPLAQHIVDRPPSSHMSYPPVDERAYQSYYSRSAPGSAHGVPPLDAPSPERLHSSGAGATVPLRVPVHEMGPAPGSSHGYPPQPVAQMGTAPYPPQAAAQPYYGMPHPPDTTPPTSAGNGRPPPNFTTDGAPIVPVGISGGKMFRCRGFGECDKVFTRSEHLARHVR